MILRQLLLIGLFAVPSLWPSSSRAEGCYRCGSGSSESCKDYCHYAKDTFAARKACEKKGCKISSVGTCPTTPNSRICQAPAKTSETSFASLACVPKFNG